MGADLRLILKLVHLSSRGFKLSPELNLLEEGRIRSSLKSSIQECVSTRRPSTRKSRRSIRFRDKLRAAESVCARGDQQDGGTTHSPEDLRQATLGSRSSSDASKPRKAGAELPRSCSPSSRARGFRRLVVACLPNDAQASCPKKKQSL